jgi:alpha-ribazole phosphatase
LAKLLLVRHGETTSNSSLRYWGKTDVGLGPTGLRQAEQLRDRLATEKIDFVYCSELRRALVTAQILASLHNLKINSCPELNEINFGEIEGLTFEEAREKYPQVAQRWEHRSPDLTYPGGESLRELEKRVAVFKNRVCQHAPGETILVVAHSGILRSLICQLLNLEMAYRWNLRVDLASISIVETYPEIAILNLLNDTSHLIDRCK